MQLSENNKEYKLIDYRIFDPSGITLFRKKSERAEMTRLYCSNSDNCPAYAQGRCVMWNFFGDPCPYGKKRKEVGYTKRARKFSEQMRGWRKEVEGVKRLDTQRKACGIGEYIYFPYPHWSLDKSIKVERRAGLFSNHEEWFNEESFTVGFFEQVVNARPQAIFGGEIKSYQKETVPVMVQHIREELPEFYNKWAEKYPDTAARFKEADYTGRRAVVSTLRPGCKIPIDKGEMVWDGSKLVIEEYSSAFLPVKGRAKVWIEPRDGESVKVTSNDQVCEGTKFVD